MSVKIMREHILYLKGIASPLEPAKIEAEYKSVKEHLAELRATDIGVTEIGHPAYGFDMDEVRQALQDNPEISTLIMDIHGNVENNRHFMALRDRADTTDLTARMWSEDFYQALGEYSQGKALNIFLFSCGSVSGCKTAATRLPLGSTLVTFFGYDDKMSYDVTPASMRAPLASKNYSEDLLLNMLCHGFGAGIYNAQVTVSTEDRKENSWPLWFLAQTECLEYDEKSSDFETKIRPALAHFISNEIIDAAFATIEGYRFSIRNAAVTKFENTPVEFANTINDDTLVDEIRLHGLLGPICAVAYLLNRAQIGAFMTATSDFYLGPLHPKPTKNTSLSAPTLQDTNIPAPR